MLSGLLADCIDLLLAAQDVDCFLLLYVYEQLRVQMNKPLSCNRSQAE